VDKCISPYFLGFGDVELLLTKYVTLQVVAFDSLSLEVGRCRLTL